MLEVLSDPESGTPDDKLRLFLIYFLLSPNVTDSEVDELTSALASSGVSLGALTYLRRMRSFSQASAKSLEVNTGAAGAGGFSKFSSLIGTTTTLAGQLVKNLVVKKHNLPVTKIVDDIMEQKQGRYNDEYKYLDPKILRGNDGGQIPRTKTTFNDSIVFVVGGGNYIEYQNLQDYVKSKNTGNAVSACKLILINKFIVYLFIFTVSAASQKRIVYGCTQMMNSDQFLSQLTLLGKEISGE